MAETNGPAADHPAVGQTQAALTGAGIGEMSVPVAEPIESPSDFTPAPEGPVGPPGIPWPGGFPQLPSFPGPIPEFKPCKINLAQGCYRLTYQPAGSIVTYRGTMRVERGQSATTISGDLYRFLNLPIPLPIPRFPIERRIDDAGGTAITSLSPAAIASLGTSVLLQPQIPIYPRGKYYSYLKVTNTKQSPPFGFGPCQLSLTAQEYVYTQPSAGSFNGTFPSTPTRTVEIVLHPVPAAPGLGSSFEGTLFEGGAAKGTVTIARVSSSFRRATVEVDVVTGAVAPQPVPAASGSASEDIRTVFATAGWNVTVEYDQTGVPIPAGVNANDCWTSANLHSLMLSVRKATTDLDKEWRLHLVVVPAELGCGRGVMYDQIAVPREGVASFCDDGYPSNESASFGTAANQTQRNVPRAFLRSACHELGHGFNQVHQEQEGGADNSIMTTTPSVANVLGGPPGVFPNDINLGFNGHVRHHLIHWPDPVVRPGGMTFGSGHSSSVPSADRLYFASDELELRLEPGADRIELGEPLRLTWTLANNAPVPIPVPSDLGAEAQHVFVRVTNPQGVQKTMRSFEVRTDSVSIEGLDPGESRSAETRVFWSSQGFAFEAPGRYQLEVELVWAQDGIPLGVKATAEVWVNFPRSDTDNEAAAILLHPEVGMYVALGGAQHLTEAVDRLIQVTKLGGEGDRPVPLSLRGYDGLLPGEQPERTGAAH